MGYEIWSAGRESISISRSFNPDVGDRIVRLWLSDRKIEKVVDLKDLGLGQWSGPSDTGLDSLLTILLWSPAISAPRRSTRLK